MFNTARITSIILIIIAFVVTLPSPEVAAEVKVDEEVRLEAGGNTIDGPGIIKLQNDLTIRVYKSKGTTPLAATLHCREGKATLNLFSFNNLQITSLPSNEEWTRTIRAEVGNRVRVDCANGDDCECIWRVDQRD